MHGGPWDDLPCCCLLMADWRIEQILHIDTDSQRLHSTRPGQGRPVVDRQWRTRTRAVAAMTRTAAGQPSPTSGRSPRRHSAGAGSGSSRATPEAVGAGRQVRWERTACPVVFHSSRCPFPPTLLSPVAVEESLGVCNMAWRRVSPNVVMGICHSTSGRPPTPSAG